MQLYKYKAKTFEGEIQEGRIEARDERHAAEQLRQREWVVVNLKEIQKTTGGGLLGGRVSRQEVMVMTQQLSTMISAGLPLSDALEMLRVQARPTFGQILSDVQRDVQAGMSLGDALSRHPKVFKDIYVALVRAGEASGKLDEVLVRLAENEEKSREFRQKTIGAMIYPVVVMIAMVVVIFVLMVFVMPQMMEMYQDFGTELPLPTQILIGVSGVFGRLWWLMIAGVVGGSIAFINWRKTPVGRERTDRWILKLPVVGPLIEMMILADFSRTMELLISAGISILQALEIVENALSNVVYQKAILQSRRALEKGMPLAATLAKVQVFPPLMAQMVSVGEETGELESVLGKVSHYYATESEQKVKNLTTAIEPLIIIVLGIGVGFVVISVVMPIYNLTSAF
jgi:type IV pilus assembly protein PilC